MLNKGKKIFLWFGLLAICYWLLATPVSAWTWGEPLVPCGINSVPGAEEFCTRCEFFHLLKNIIDFGLIAVLPVGSTLLFIIAGIYYILGGSNPSFHGKAKDLFTNTLYGIVVIALAWIITNTILINFSDGGSWGEFVCTNPVAVTPVTTPGGPSPSASGSVSPSASVSPTAGQCPQSNLNLCQGQTTACSSSSCSQYSAAINQYGGQYVNVIKSIMFNESSCNVRAASAVGACGLMQLLPSTANIFRSRCGVTQQVTCGWLQSSANASASICIAAEYIKSLGAGVCGSSARGIAAGYNGGSGACQPSQSCAGETSCAGGPTAKWECLYDNTAHTICNNGFDETRNYSTKVQYCAQNPGF